MKLTTLSICGVNTGRAAGNRAAIFYVILGLFFYSNVNAGDRPPDRAGPPQKPNIVILLADDLGWNDVGYHGSRIRTPHIDQLAREGVELDRFYVTPWCSPTRAGLMTGRFAHRYGYHYIPDAILGYVPTGADTLAEMLDRAGYKRRAYVGKWHLQFGKRGGHPLDQGFTEFYGMLGGAVDYYTHKPLTDLKGDVDWFRNREKNHDSGYTTDLLGDEAVRFLKGNTGNQPFFLYVAFNAPHVPLQPTGESFNSAPAGAHSANLVRYTNGDGVAHCSQRYEEAANSQRHPEDNNVALCQQIYSAMVNSMDSNIGRILGAIDESGLRENTLVLFLSDNGADTYSSPGDNSPFSGSKGTVSEGGVRVPAIVRWPAFLPSGRRISAPLSYVDVFPTFAKIAGLASPLAQNVDGINVLEILTGSQLELDRSIYLGAGAMVDANWKLVGDELFAIKTDPGEKIDVARSHPDVVKKFHAEVQQIETP